MALNRITPADLAGKGNVGMPDTPGLSTEAMQRKLDELSLDVIVPKFNELVDALAAQTGAADIGAEGGSVQAALNALEEGKATVNALDALETRVEAAETQKADKSEVLRKGAGEAYTPAGPYDPATRKYVDDTVTSIGAGDMSRAVYDTDGDGVVDDAAALGGVAASEYVTAGTLAAAEERIASAAAAAQTTADTAVTDAAAAQTTATTAQATADAAMPKAGGTFTGNVTFADGRLNTDLVTIETLWENASPASQFAAQTISIDFKGYERFLCVGVTHINAYVCMMGYVEGALYPGQSETNFQVTLSLYTGYNQTNGSIGRLWKFDLAAGTISWSGGIFADNTNNSNIGIPLRLYGIKGGIL